jgi:hypothetical protein
MQKSKVIEMFSTGFYWLNEIRLTYMGDAKVYKGIAKE